MSDRQNRLHSLEYPPFVPEDDIVWLIINVIFMPLWMMLTHRSVLVLYLLLSLFVNLFLALLGWSPALSGFLIVYLSFLGLVVYLAYVKPLRDRSWP